MDDLNLQQRLTQALDATDFLEDGSEQRTRKLNEIRIAIKTALLEIAEGEAGAEYSAIATLEQVTPVLNQLATEFVESDTIPPSGPRVISSNPPPST